MWPQSIFVEEKTIDGVKIHSMFNIFKRSKKADDTQKMGMLQRIAMKKLEKMGPEERDKIMKDALKPENKEKLLAVIEQMKKSGQISDEQIEMAKKKLGL